MGYMGDRVSKKAIMFWSLTVEGIGYLFLWLGDWQTAVGITLVLGFVVCEGMMGRRRSHRLGRAGRVLRTGPFRHAAGIHHLRLRLGAGGVAGVRRLGCRPFR